MNIFKKSNYGYSEDYSSRWEELIIFENYRYLYDIKRDLYAIKRMMSIDFKDLSDDEFYELMSNFYDIYLTKEDIIDIVSKVNGISYDKIQELNSRMVYEEIVTEGHGRSFDWWEETYQCAWLVIVAKGFTIDETYNYSKEEIESMAKNKQIVSLKKYSKDIGFEPDLSYEREELEIIDIPRVTLKNSKSDELQWSYFYNIVFDSLVKDDTEFGNKVYSCAIAKLRKRLNKKKVLNDCLQIISFLDENICMIDKIVTQSKYGIDEDKKEEYLGLSKELSDSHRQISSKIKNR